jgi:hypothetical protein
VHFHDFAPGSEPFGIEIQAVYTEEEVLEEAMTVGGNLKVSLEPVALTNDFSAATPAPAASRTSRPRPAKGSVPEGDQPGRRNQVDSHEILIICKTMPVRHASAKNGVLGTQDTMRGDFA